MQSYRITTRLPQALRVSKSPMACYGTYSRPVRRFNGFPQFPVADFSPLFRLFDEELSQLTARPIRSWQPRFDVREEKDNFQLHGELPGLDPKDISIEFADDNTMVVRGRTVREHSEGTKPQAVEASTPQKQLEETNDTASDAGSTSSYKQPTVEDEFVEVENEKSAASEVAKSAPEQEQPAEKAPESKYWVSERSVGEFHRTFTFPGKVDQDAVTASLKNGILNVVVPKALAKEPRKISIQ